MNKSIIKISDLHLDEISHIFELADKAQDLKFASDAGLSACYSFEGNSIRTRATFIKALNDLRISPIEIPNILKTQEAVGHLAGYLDNWFDIFIIRDRDHKKLALFSESTNKPTINAMTSEAHPCEVLADVYAIRVGKGDMRSFKYCIIGPPTNVLNSWRIAGEVLGLDIIHVLPGEYMSREPQTGKVTNSKSDGLLDADVILTDAWPQGFDDKSFQLTLKDLENVKPGAWVIPCPPFNVENEINKDTIESAYFAGYDQKRYLYHVQKALIYFMLKSPTKR
jgi:ornithine carbamoyltransferase